MSSTAPSPDVRCSDVSRGAAEPLSATGPTASTWLVVEVPGTWPRDVGAEGALPKAAEGAVRAWLEATPDSRLQFVRRPQRQPERPLAFVVIAGETERDVRRFELDGLGALADVDLACGGEAVDAPLVLVCGHGTRDACCALRGTAVFGALAERLGEEELWISSHHGGHRFAANVLVLPAGLSFGRVELDDASLVVARALGGRISLPHYRGRTSYPSPVQAAEHAVRTAAGLEGVGDLWFVEHEGEVVRFRAFDGSDYAAQVEEWEGPPVAASCGDELAPHRLVQAHLI